MVEMIGMACLEPEKIAKKWSWDEVMWQLHMRYQRELASSSRPALRLITTQDAPPSGPIVLCISNIFWTDEHIDDAGQSVLHILNWRSRMDVLRTGRKIACSGARLDSSKKDPMEILEAYNSVRLILSGNSTHLASWHTSLGFQSTPFVATLRSLTPDGGGVPLLDLIITNIYPIAFIEFITLSTGEIIREGPRIEKDEAIEEAQWQPQHLHLTSTSEASGQITFCGTDSSEFTGDITFVSIMSMNPASDFWGLDQSIKYGSTSILSTTAGILARLSLQPATLFPHPHHTGSL
ncbi:hypothetical protein BU17DRAFT_97834 [Hysterangium stoloniferum]|nr:hypothetical protein BU17DRAFT_97834 [Hysterangium stoloniferum]